MNALRALLTVFDVDTAAASTKLKSLDGLIDRAKGHLGSLAKTAFGAFSIHAIKEFIDEQIELGSKINDTAEKLGVGTDELQKFQFAAGLAGVESESAAQALGFLNKNIGEAIDGGKEQAKTFAELGIALKDGHGQVRELGDIIPELADAFEKMDSAQERTTTAMKLFGKSGAALIPLLKGGSGGLGELYEQFDKLGLLIDEDFIKKADEAGDQIDILKAAFRTLKTRIAIEVLPGITELAKKFQGWMGWVIKLTKETNIAKEAWAILGGVAVLWAGKAFVGWAKFFGLFKGNQGILKSVLSLGEFGLVIAAVVALALVFEDLFTLVNGGQSVIGDFLTETFGIEYTTQFVEQLKGAWNNMQASFESIGPPLKELGKMLLDISVAALPVVIGLFVDLVRVVGALFVGLMSVVEAIAKIPEAIKKGDLGVLGKVFEKSGNTIFGENGLLGSNAKSATLAAFSTPSAPAVRQPVGMQRGDANVDLNQDVNITINGASDPSTTGRAVASQLRGSQADGLRAAAAAAFRGAGEEE